MINYESNRSVQLQSVEELEIIKGKIGMQEKDRNLCTIYMEKISDYINHISPSSVKNQSQFEYTLISLKAICDNVNLDLQDLNNLKSCICNIDNVSKDSLKEFVDEYNIRYVEIMQRINTHDAQMRDFTTSILQNYAFVFSSNAVPIIDNVVSYDIPPITLATAKIPSVHSSNTNILIVSEKDQMVYLPYKIEEVEEYLKSKRKNKHNYSSVQEIVNKKYIIPLSLFKFPTISRFREVFNLVRKEDGLLEAFETAVELMSNFNLDPIVVRACRNAQELNIFVDCLEEGETDKFPCFQIRYEIAPVVKKKNKNEEFFVNG